MKMAFTKLAGFLANRPVAVAAMFGLFFLPLPSTAETIEVKFPSGITASANYHKGLPALPAVLILHGFLQTQQSQPMSALASNLASRGYTVLSPTISLGINRRSQSMACEAVHTHTMTEDVNEVTHWMNWLSARGHKNIVLVGFSSTGNSQILLYNAKTAHPAVKKSVLISFNPILINTSERQKTRHLKLAKPQANAMKPGKYSLGYCKNNFAATANSYLSYADFDLDKIRELLQQSRVPTEIILGSDDTILPQNWLSQLKTMKAHVTVIPNANHFFEGTSEFDLAEEVEAMLKNLPAHSS